jgi:hypothetical protein
MENLIAIVIGLAGIYAVSIYFGRQTDKLILTCSERSSADASRVEALIVSEAASTRALLERLG